MRLSGRIATLRQSIYRCYRAGLLTGRQAGISFIQKMIWLEMNLHEPVRAGLVTSLLMIPFLPSKPLQDHMALPKYPNSPLSLFPALWSPTALLKTYPQSRYPFCR
jgi:hypothetical protein